MSEGRDVCTVGSLPAVTRWALVISEVTGTLGLANTTFSSQEGIDVDSSAPWLASFSPQPGVPLCPVHPLLLQLVLSSYFICIAQGPAHFLITCLIFFSDVFKLLYLEKN